LVRGDSVEEIIFITSTYLAMYSIHRNILGKKTYIIHAAQIGPHVNVKERHGGLKKETLTVQQHLVQKIVTYASFAFWK
jgi:hypothetical protein